MNRRQFLDHLSRPAIAATAALMPAWGQAGETLTLSVVPQTPIAAIDAEWLPFANELGRTVGHKMQLLHKPTIPEFERLFLEGTPDLIFCNPYHVVMANRSAGYLPLVRNRTPLRGLLVVRADSPVKSVSDLNDKTLLFPAPNAFGASLYLRALFTEQEKIRFKTLYVKTHTNVFRGVLNGQGLGGGCVRSTLDREPIEVRQDLRILYQTPDAAPHALCAHPRVPPAMRAALLQRILALANTPMAALLPREELDLPVAADYQRDYLPLARLGIEKFVVNS